jgi:hypothetical protein
MIEEDFDISTNINTSIITNTTTIINGKYCCIICSKQYTKKSSLDKHKILCDFRLKTKREKQIEVEEIGDMPSYQELVKIIQEMSFKQMKMEEKIEEMQKLIGKKKEKLDVITWLNSNVIATIGFLEWISIGFIVNPEHFENLMKSENTIFDIIQQIFEYNLRERDEFIYPIRCFTQKQSKFYICEKNEDNTIMWKLLPVEDIKVIISNLQKNIVSQLIKWKAANQKNFDDNSKLATTFNKVVINVMNIVQESTSTRIKNILYNYLKKDVKHIEFST